MLDNLTNQIVEENMVEDVAAATTAPATIAAAPTLRPRNFKNIKNLLLQNKRASCTKCGAKFINIPKKKRKNRTFVDDNNNDEEESDDSGDEVEQEQETLDVTKTTIYNDVFKCWTCAKCHEIINVSKKNFSIALACMPQIDFLSEVHTRLMYVHRMNTWADLVRQLFIEHPNFPRTLETLEPPLDKTRIDFNLLTNIAADGGSFDEQLFSARIQLCIFLDNLVKEYNKQRQRGHKKSAQDDESDDNSDDEEDDESAADESDDVDSDADDANMVVKKNTPSSLTMTPQALEKMKILANNGFFKFVTAYKRSLRRSKKIDEAANKNNNNGNGDDNNSKNKKDAKEETELVKMSNPLIVFSKNQINKYDQFLPIIFEQVRRERELEANELKQLECKLEKALKDNEFSSLMNYTQISNSIVDKSAQQQQTVDAIRDQIKCFKRHLFFKRLVGHYKGPCGYAAKKGSSKRIWRKLRTIIALVNCHNEMHPTKRIAEIEYNNGKNIDAFLPNLKHQLKNESWVRENVDGQWVFLPQKQADDAADVAATNVDNVAVDAATNVDATVARPRWADVKNFFVIYVMCKHISFQYPHVTFVAPSQPAVANDKHRASPKRVIDMKITNLSAEFLQNLPSTIHIKPATLPSEKKLFAYLSICNLQPLDKIIKIHKKLACMGNKIWLTNVYAYRIDQDQTDTILGPVSEINDLFAVKKKLKKQKHKQQTKKKVLKNGKNGKNGKNQQQQKKQSTLDKLKQKRKDRVIVAVAAKKGASVNTKTVPIAAAAASRKTTRVPSEKLPPKQKQEKQQKPEKEPVVRKRKQIDDQPSQNDEKKNKKSKQQHKQEEQYSEIIAAKKKSRKHCNEAITAAAVV